MDQVATYKKKTFTLTFTPKVNFKSPSPQMCIFGLWNEARENPHVHGHSGFTPEPSCCEASVVTTSVLPSLNHEQ